jgi:serine/threonine-protein kinase
MECWGLNTNGAALADSNMTSMHLTPGIAFSSGVTSISTNVYTSCAAHAGEYVCWGGGGSGQLGTGVEQDYSVGGVANAPAAHPASDGIVAGGITTGTSDDNCAIVPGVGLECWGVNSNQEILGAPSGLVLNPYLIVPSSVATFAQVAMGDGHICGVTTGGALYCWGTNGDGQLGTGNSTAQTTSIGAAILASGVSSVSASQSSTCALWNGDLYCWGGNANGQYANGGVALTKPSTRIFP